MKIGVMVESFRKGLHGGLQAAVELGAQGVQMYATEGDTHPDVLKGTARRELLRHVRDLGIEFSAICADFGGHGFQLASENAKRLEDSKKVVDLTVALECKVVTTHIGVVPGDRNHDRYKVMLDACRQLAQYGESAGVTFAVETGPEPAAVLCGFLDDIALPNGIGVNFDPANLVMVIQEDIPVAVARLSKYIVHTHAKDGVNLQPVDAEKLYASFSGQADEFFNWEDYIREMPLGLGDVDFVTYLAALRKVGYDGYLTIEREVGNEPRKDIEMAIGFLKKLLAS